MCGPDCNEFLQQACGCRLGIVVSIFRACTGLVPWHFRVPSRSSPFFPCLTQSHPPRACSFRISSALPWHLTTVSGSTRQSRSATSGLPPHPATRHRPVTPSFPQLRLALLAYPCSPHPALPSPVLPSAAAWALFSFRADSSGIASLCFCYCFFCSSAFSTAPPRCRHTRTADRLFSLSLLCLASEFPHVVCSQMVSPHICLAPGALSLLTEHSAFASVLTTSLAAPRPCPPLRFPHTLTWMCRTYTGTLCCYT